MDLIDDFFIAQPNSLIDIVFTYVNPSDNIWKEKYLLHNKSNHISSSRFDNNQEQIKFSLLTLKKYAYPLINNIYIVSDNQQFDLDFLQDKFLIDKIRWIDHTDIIDSKYLPTFNSMVIEAFLWKIPNINDTFVYFNDDMFVGSHVFYSDFFDTDGSIKQFYSERKSLSNHPWYQNINETNDLFNHAFKTKQFITPTHAPYHLSKIDMQICFGIFFKNLKPMFERHKIRSYKDSHNLVFLSAMYSSNFKRSKNIKTSFAFINNCNNLVLKNLHQSKKKKFYCFHAHVPKKDQYNTYKELKKIFAIDENINTMIYQDINTTG